MMREWLHDYLTVLPVGIAGFVGWLILSLLSGAHDRLSAAAPSASEPRPGIRLDVLDETLVVRNTGLTKEWRVLPWGRRASAPATPGIIARGFIRCGEVLVITFPSEGAQFDVRDPGGEWSWEQRRGWGSAIPTGEAR